MRVTLPYDRPIAAHVSLRPKAPPGVALIYPVGLLLLSVAMVVVPQRTGPLAVAQVFAPYLFLPLLFFVPLAFMRGAMALRVVLLLCVLVFGARFSPRMSATTPAPSPTPAGAFTVLTWNAYAGNTNYTEIAARLAQKPADVIALQELDGDWLNDDEGVRETYPYRLSGRDDTPPGMVLLSIYPILDHGTLDGPRSLWDIPRLMWAKLDLGEGQTVTVVTAHPISSYTVGKGCDLPVCFSPQWRDRQVAAMHTDFLDPLLASGERVVLAGDFNLTEREPAYGDLSAGLQDAFKAVGAGVGTTWRPAFLMNQRLGLLRIDYLFSSPNVAPLSVAVDCTPRDSDHCMVVGRFAAR